MRQRSRARSTAACAVLACLAAGCDGGDGICEAPLSADRTPVREARLPSAWWQGNADSFRILVTPRPYRVTDHALEQLRIVMTEQAGLRIEIAEGEDTGLPAIGTLDYADIIKIAHMQMPTDAKPTIVLVVVENSNCPDATYGFAECEYVPRPAAVIALHRGPLGAISIGPISPETMEATVVVHEVGHWLGVPARDFHTSAVDGLHCTNARCVMFKGSRAGACAIVANLSSGLPVRFCPDCAEELAELRRRTVAP